MVIFLYTARCEMKDLQEEEKHFSQQHSQRNEELKRNFLFMIFNRLPYQIVEKSNKEKHIVDESMNEISK